MRTSACYPLMVGGQAVGALYIDLRTARQFTEHELLLLDTFVHLAAVAIYNTRQFEGMNRALRRKVAELERVQRADRLISSRRNVDETFREILNAALNLTGAEYGSFRLLDKNAGLLRLRALVGGDPDGQRTSLPPDVQSGVVGWVARQRQPARIDDLPAAALGRDISPPDRPAPDALGAGRAAAGLGRRAGGRAQRRKPPPRPLRRRSPEHAGGPGHPGHHRPARRQAARHHRGRDRAYHRPHARRSVCAAARARL